MYEGQSRVRPHSHQILVATVASLPGQSCDGPRDLIKRWRFWIPGIYLEQRKILGRFWHCLTQDLIPRGMYGRTHITDPKHPIKIQKKRIYCCCPCLWAFFVYFSPKHLESSRISWLIRVCLGGSCWVQWKHHCPLETIRFGQTGIN